MAESKKIQDGVLVFPGQKLGEIEEFIPDENCFESDGIIYSSTIGTVTIDSKNHKIGIMKKKNIIIPQRGMKGLAYVVVVKRQIAMLNIYFLIDEHGPHPVLVPYSSQLHISNVSRDYIKSMFEAVRPGDWVFAQIIKASEIPIHLSLQGKGLGVFLAYCIFCGGELKLIKYNHLQCISCGETQERTTSINYGRFKYSGFGIEK